MSHGNGTVSLFGAWKASLSEVQGQVGRLVKSHVELASVELKQAASSAGLHIGLIFTGGLALLFSVALLSVGLAVLLGTHEVLRMGTGPWLLIFGALYLLGGGILSYTMIQALKRDVRLLDQTREELREGIVWVKDEILRGHSAGRT